MEEVERQMEFLSQCFGLFLGIGITGTFLAGILFVCFDIRRMFGRKTGIEQKKRLRQLETEFFPGSIQEQSGDMEETMVFFAGKETKKKMKKIFIFLAFLLLQIQSENRVLIQAAEKAEFSIQPLNRNGEQIENSEEHLLEAEYGESIFLAVDTERDLSRELFVFSSDPQQILLYGEDGQQADSEGKIKIKGSERVRIKFLKTSGETGAFSLKAVREREDNLPGAEATLQIRVKPRTLHLTGRTHTELFYEKIYDKQEHFSSYEQDAADYAEDIWKGIDSICLDRVLEGEEVQIGAIKGTQEILAVKRSEKGEAAVQNTRLRIQEASLMGKDAGHYQLDLQKPVEIEAKIRILPRAVYLQVSDGEREYGNRREEDPESIFYPEGEEPVREWREFPGFCAQTEGIVDREDLEGICFPLPTEMTYEKKEYPDYPEGDYENLLIVNRMLSGRRNGDPGDNYRFEFENFSPGTLRIRKEDPAARGYRNYLVYEEKEGQLHISRETMESENFGRVWIGGDARQIRIKLSDKAGLFYDQIYLKGESPEEDLEISKGKNGIPVEKEMDSKEHPKVYSPVLYLKNSVSGQESMPFSILLFLDPDPPKLEIILPEAHTPDRIYGEDVMVQIHVRDQTGYTDSAFSEGCRLLMEVWANGKRTQRDLLSDPAEEAVFSYTVDSMKNNSNEVEIRAEATDPAGNRATAECRIHIDRTAPEITANYFSSAKVENKKYYGQPVQAELLYTERNFSSQKEYLWFYVETDEKAGKNYSLEELEKELGICWSWVELGEEIQQDKKAIEEYTDCRQHKLLLNFEQDGYYRFCPYIRDQAEVSGVSNQVKGSLREFIIDREEPVIRGYCRIQEGKRFQDFKQEDEIYTKQPVEIKVSIQEENPDPEVKVSVTKNGEKMLECLELHTVQKGSYSGFCKFKEEGKYTVEISCRDLAGNMGKWISGTFTVDKTVPEGSICVENVASWDNMRESAPLCVFSNQGFRVQIKGKDRISPVLPLEYACFSGEQTCEELEKYQNWKQAEKIHPAYTEFFLSPDVQTIVYARITDSAGNRKYLSTEGLLAEDTKPEVALKVIKKDGADPVSKGDVTLEVQAEDPVEEGMFSGLKQVWCVISAGGNVTKQEKKTLFQRTLERGRGKEKFTGFLTIPAETYNSSQIQVQAFAEDLCGNTAQSIPLECKIDTTAPEIDIKWDTEQPENEKYYPTSRTATVTIKERSFSPERVRFRFGETESIKPKISQWTIGKETGISDEAVSSCTIVFSEEGEYQFTAECRDLAGNYGRYEKSEEFIIDKTPPVCTVFYNGSLTKPERYAKISQIVEIRIRERNFRESDAKAAITASFTGEETAVPVLGTFTHQGDLHTAVLLCEEEGSYSFAVSCKDLAGNTAEEYCQEEFTIDKTPPKIQILNLQDGSANKGEVAPQIKIYDLAYEAVHTRITITGNRRGKIFLPYGRKTGWHGETIKFEDFSREENTDDVYRLKAEAEDRAGNRTEQEIQFSVNRYGSVFGLDAASQQWMTAPESGYVYLQEEKKLGIWEYNVDTVRQAQILVDRDGELRILEEGKDYQVEEAGQGTFWKKRYYRILAENFSQDGYYTVVLNSEDRAGNLMSNTSVKRQEGNLPIAFAVDKTPPSLVISGAEDGEVYKVKEKKLELDVKDNLFLEEVGISVNGKTRIYDREELEKNQGKIPIFLTASAQWQKIQIWARDAAGNFQGEGEKEPMTLRILVSAEEFRLHEKKEMWFWLLGGGILSAAGGFLLFLWKKRLPGKS